MSAHTSFSAWIDDYLAVRRRAGFDLKVVGNQLRQFAHFSEEVGHNGTLTIQLAAQWASSSSTGRRLTAARRIEVLRPFAANCRQFDPATEIPPQYLFGRAHRRLTLHIFTDDEVRDLLVACDELYPPGGLRGASCRTIFGLIAATGLRISEATGLTRSDVDLEQRLLHIRCTKFGKSGTDTSYDGSSDATLCPQARPRFLNWLHQRLLCVRLRSASFNKKRRVRVQNPSHRPKVAVLAAAIPHRGYMIFDIRSSVIDCRTGTPKGWTSTAAFLRYRLILGMPKSQTRTGMKQPRPSCWQSQPNASCTTMEVHHEHISSAVFSSPVAEVLYGTSPSATTRKPLHCGGLP